MGSWDFSIVPLAIGTHVEMTICLFCHFERSREISFLFDTNGTDFHECLMSFLRKQESFSFGLLDSRVRGNDKVGIVHCQLLIVHCDKLSRYTL